LVVIGHTGSITLDALRWPEGIGASFLQLGADGEVIAATHPQSYEQPRLRRAQALALGSPAGLELARWLVVGKLTGQLRMLDELERHVAVPDPLRFELEDAVAQARLAEDDKRLRFVEGMGAAAYWSAWSALPVSFARQDSDRVPQHWRTFHGRASAVTRQPRYATNPANAILNYLYAILESEATIAARIVGFDPGLGVFHLDTRFRQSLSSDLMEPVRPEVDRYLLELLTKRTFGARDFFETERGVCRLTPPHAKELVKTSRHWGRLVGKVAEDLAHRLIEPPKAEPLPRLITRPHGRAAAKVPALSVEPAKSPRAVARRCAVCGGPTPRRADRTCSQECLHIAKVQQGRCGRQEASGVDARTTSSRS
jgi:CRISPR-associated endonuclease Cas1